MKKFTRGHPRQVTSYRLPPIILDLLRTTGIEVPRALEFLCTANNETLLKAENWRQELEDAQHELLVVREQAEELQRQEHKLIAVCTGISTNAVKTLGMSPDEYMSRHWKGWVLQEKERINDLRKEVRERVPHYLRGEKDTPQDFVRVYSEIFNGYGVCRTDALQMAKEEIDVVKNGV